MDVQVHVSSMMKAVAYNGHFFCIERRSQRNFFSDKHVEKRIFIVTSSKNRKPLQIINEPRKFEVFVLNVRAPNSLLILIFRVLISERALQ